MSYKIVRNDNYLMHFNKNHSKANGQFISGDGDDDGIIDDHHNYSRNKRGATSGSNIKSTTAKSTSAKSTNTKKKKIDPHEAVGVGIGIAVGAAALAAMGYKMYRACKDLEVAHQNNEAIKNWGQSWYDRNRAAKAKVVGGDW